MNIGPKPEGIQFIQEEMKVKQEESEKKAALPYDIVRTALANLFPDAAISHEKLRNKISSVITAVSEGDKSILEVLNPHEKIAILSLANIYAELSQPIESLEKFLSDLLALGDFDKAIEFAKSLTDINNIIKPIALGQIYNAVKEEGNLGKMIEIAHHMPPVSIKKLVMGQECSKALRAIDDADQFIELIEKASLSEGVKEYHIIMNLIRKWTEVGNIDKAIEIANKIPQAATRGYVFLDIFESLKKNGDKDRASEIGETAMYNFQQAIDNIDEAIKIANEKIDIDRRDAELLHITHTLLKIVNPRNLTKAKEVANTITNPLLKNHRLGVINTLIQNSFAGG
jgi:tetratricopeptide (TPR) repeat protein